jgi:hypothetical protein
MSALLSLSGDTYVTCSLSFTEPSERVVPDTCAGKQAAGLSVLLLDVHQPHVPLPAY